MEIGKNEIVGLANSIKYDNLDRKNSRNHTHVKNEKHRKRETTNKIQLDQVRSKAMRLDDEIKEHQNAITNYQMQSKFLKETGGNIGWHEQLLAFLREVTSFKQKDTSFGVPKNITFESYNAQLEEKIQLYRTKLSRRQVQLQNIFASGLLVEPDMNPNANKKELSFKYGQVNSEDIFKNLRSSTVRSLLI